MPAETPHEAVVFVSHSSQDHPEAERIVAALEAAGIPCWMAPRDIPAGSEWAPAIIGGINTSRIFLLLLSESSNDSPQVLREVERAVSRRSPVLTVRRANVPLSPGMEYFISVSHWLDAAGLPLESALPGLVDRVRALMVTPAAAAAPNTADSGAAQAPAISVHSSITPPAPPPCNLPQSLSEYVGRAAEMERLRILLGGGGEVTADKRGGVSAPARLVTLTGPGGTGKTRLAIEVGRRLLESDPMPCPDGVFLIELATLTDPAQVPHAVVAALGVREEGGRTIADLVAETLRPARALLILDGCDRVLPAAANFAATLLRSCPGVRLLVTSRERLAVAGEQVVNVAPLAVPPEGAVRASEVGNYDSVRLFIERSRAECGWFELSDENSVFVSEICRRLDGLPLAIELAASRARSLSPRQIAERLSQRFRLLTGGSRDAPVHQQTLRALIDWSFDLLSEAEKALFCRLSVFAGGWTLEAAEKICASEEAGFDDWEVIDLLSSLVDKSLTLYDEGEESASAEGRYRMLESVRQYAADRLNEAGPEERDGTHARHADYYAAMAADAAPQLRGADPGRALAKLDGERANLRAALEELADRGTDRLRFAADLASFWYVRGHLTEGLDALNAALASGAPAPDDLRGAALYGAGVLAQGLGHSDEARRLFTDALVARRAVGDRSGEADTLSELGAAALADRDIIEAQRLFRAAALLDGELGRAETSPGPLVGLAAVLLLSGRLKEASEQAKRALEAARRGGRRRHEADALTVDARALLMGGHTAAARACAEQALAVAHGMGYRSGERDALLVALAADRHLGDIAAARTRLGMVESIDRALRQDDVAGPSVLCESADLERVAGEAAAAMTDLRDALDGAVRDRATAPMVAEIVERCASLRAALGDGERAARLYGWAAAVRERSGQPVPPLFTTAWEHDTALLKRSLGEATYHAAIASGAELSTEEAISVANGAPLPVLAGKI